MSESNGLRIGDRVNLYYSSSIKPSRKGTVVGLYERFFNVHYGRYQESFLWVDMLNGELRVVQAGKQSASRAG
ncbi:MAG: hypothetical protein ACYC2T_08310 [Bacillota bacterium]